MRVEGKWSQTTTRGVVRGGGDELRVSEESAVAGRDGAVGSANDAAAAAVTTSIAAALLRNLEKRGST